MAERRTKLLILLSGIVIATATPLCHAQDSGKLFDVKIPRTEVLPAFVPEITTTAAPSPVRVKPDKELSETTWYWRILEGIAIGAARYNTEKQNAGRPNPYDSLAPW
jgi:hypothetical protein